MEGTIAKRADNGAVAGASAGPRKLRGGLYAVLFSDDILEELVLMIETGGYLYPSILFRACRLFRRGVGFITVIDARNAQRPVPHELLLITPRLLKVIFPCTRLPVEIFGSPLTTEVVAQRGMIQSLDLSNTLLGGSHMRGLALLTSLKTLDLSYCECPGGGPINTALLATLTNLEELSICGTSIGGYAMRMVTALVSLKALSLDYSSHANNLGVVSNLTSLTCLSLNCCVKGPIASLPSAASLPTALRGLGSLVSLHLFNTNAFMHLRPHTLTVLTSLTELNAGSCAWDAAMRNMNGRAVTPEDMCRCLSALETLDLKDNGIGRNPTLLGGVKAHLSRLARLRLLDLCDNDIVEGQFGHTGRGNLEILW
jgi:hypothetical protein